MNSWKKSSPRRWLLLGTAVALVAASIWPAHAQEATLAAGSFKVQPAAIDLVHPRRPHSILATGQLPDGRAIDLTSQAVFQSSDPAVARVTSLGWVEPVANGAAVITVTAGGQSAQVAVKVQLPAATPHSFRHDAMPALSKGGCNMGACHGYSLGKNGFKLSLRGADPPADFLSLTDEYLERRVNRHDPAASLLLRKAIGDVPHKGGVRFEPGSLSYNLLLGWINDGAPSDLEDPVQIESLHIYPPQVVIAPKQQHQLQLIAQYSDGARRDVTRLGIFTANTERVAGVDDEGLVTTHELGETAVVARFERIFATANFIVLDANPNFVPTPLPDHLVDRHVIQKLNDLKILPSGPVDDVRFLRRIHVDLIGLQPTPEELLAFQQDASPDKRQQAIERLFQRPEFVDRWSLKWGDLLQNARANLNDPAVYAFREWIRTAVAENMPLDQFVRTVLTSRGGVMDDPTSAFFAVSKDADDTLQRSVQVFCGVRMLCARCHPHPAENWTQVDYYGVHSFFNQVGVKADQRLVGIPNAKSVVLNLAAGYSTNPRTGRPQPPRYLGGAEPEITPQSDRRELFARWLTAPENPFFARSMVNRYWSYFFHRGIIDPVDDLRTTNPPINPALLDALTRDFVAHRFDVQHLMRLMVTSQTYQRESATNPSNAHDDANFSHYIPRRLGAEALLDSFVQATGVRENFANAPAGFTAAQLPDADVDNEFLSLFGKPQRMEACECERDDTSNMLQALHFINSNGVLDRLSNPGGRVMTLTRTEKDDRALVGQLYLWIVCRAPTEPETALALQFFQSKGANREEAAQDLAWALFNSRDFQLLH